MNRLRLSKQNTIKSLSSIFNSASMVVVILNQGLNANDFKEFRRNIAASNGGCKVAKNTLTKIALSESDKQYNMDNNLSGPSFLVYSQNDDFSTTAKAILSAIKSHEDTIQITSAIVEDKVLSSEEFLKIATLPSKNALRGQLLSVIASPMSKLMHLLKAPNTKLVGTLEAYTKK